MGYITDNPDASTGKLDNGNMSAACGRLAGKRPVVQREAEKIAYVEALGRKHNSPAEGARTANTTKQSDMRSNNTSKPHCIGIGSNTIVSGKLAERVRENRNNC